jgi:hypothetical protein
MNQMNEGAEGKRDDQDRSWAIQAGLSPGYERGHGDQWGQQEMRSLGGPLPDGPSERRCPEHNGPEEGDAGGDGGSGGGGLHSKHGGEQTTKGHPRSATAKRKRDRIDVGRTSGEKWWPQCKKEPLLDFVPACFWAG